MSMYAVNEIIEMTLEKEVMRRDFYAEAAKKFRNSKAKKLFSDLERWESIHVSKVKELKERLKLSPLIDSGLGELHSYLRSVVDSKLYTSVSMKDLLKGVKSVQEAITYAIGFEKDAILFFNEFLPFFIGKDEKVIKKLIDEEKNHIRHLFRMKGNKFDKDTRPGNIAKQHKAV